MIMRRVRRALSEPEARDPEEHDMSATGVARSDDGWKITVIPTGAERSEAEWRDLFICLCRHEQVPRLRFAPLGMTENGGHRR
jgi:hypothetical protein